MKQLTQGHTASKQQNRDLNSVLTPKASASLSHLCLLGEEELSLDFPGGSVAKDLCFHCRHVGSIPDRGCSACRVVQPEKKKRKNLSSGFYGSGLPCGSAGKESARNAEDLGSIPGLGRSQPGEGKGYLLQYSGLENAMDCIVHGVTKSRTRLNDFHLHFHSMALFPYGDQPKILSGRKTYPPTPSRSSGP